MGVGNIIKVIKEIHPESIILVKIGTFYSAYGKDAYIIAYLFNYNIKKVDKDLNSCGFPKSALNKILTQLEDKKINYILLDKSLNYEVEDKMDFKAKNTYKEIYIIAHKFISRKNKINEIYSYLIDNISEKSINDKINRIEEILYEI